MLLILVNLMVVDVLACSIEAKPTRKEILSAVEQTVSVLNQHYIYADKTTISTEILMRQLSRSDLNQIQDWHDFTRYIGLVLRKVTDDGYLDFVRSKTNLAGEQAESESNLINAANYGFNRIEILTDNIGYMKIDHFYQNREAELAAAHAFEYLSNTDAMIIDLRDAEADSLSLAQFIMSYFVEVDTPLSQVLYEKQNKTELISAIERPKSAHFKQNYPLYILTSAFSSSSAELISYTLKHLGKAVVIGEQTMGTALIVQQREINSCLNISMPIAIPIHPKTKTNWQDNGVSPDIESSAKLSFDIALQLARENLGKL